MALLRVKEIVYSRINMNMKNINNKSQKTLRGLEAEKWMEELWGKLLDKISKMNSKSGIKKILEKLISKNEKKMILRRLGVLALVRSGMSYHEIGETLWISHATISTIKKNVFNTAANYKSYKDFYGGPRRYSGDIKISKSFWDDLFWGVDLWDLLKNPPRPPGIGLKN